MSEDSEKNRIDTVLAPYPESAKTEITKMVDKDIISPVEDHRNQIDKSLMRVLESTPEQLGLLRNLDLQYPIMEAILKRYEISTDGMPTWEQVDQGLTKEILDKALNLVKPTLLLVPPSTRQSKVDAIDKHPAYCQKDDTYTVRFDNNWLWNNGWIGPANKWRVSVVEGVQDVKQDYEIYNRKRRNTRRRNSGMSADWVCRYRKHGLDVIKDADTYLILAMRNLARNKPIDQETFTVLNGCNYFTIEGPTPLACCSWDSLYGSVKLSTKDPFYHYDDLRLRGLVEVDIL